MNTYYKEYSEFLAEHFDGKVQKLSVDVGFTCPNRDGTVGYGGCIYCNNMAFSPDWEKRSEGVAEQIARGKDFFGRKYPEMRYLAYFQSYTSTYAPSEKLLGLYREALAQPGVVGLIIGTRPDCMPDSLLDSISKLDAKVFIEYGAESSHDNTLSAINRCHTWAQTVDAVERTARLGIPVGLHLILGLPGETEEMMAQTVRQVSALPVSTVKFHQLQILKGTRLEKIASELDIPTYTAEEYASLCSRLLKHLRRDIAVERFVAQAPADMLISPRWGLKNYQFVSLLHKILSK
ncbi:MAG: TIGR01212 family radical SAM protein [Muribaculaceae bacterium]|nr:TIGR01212 family radical SAM protein [Muribaculaceae bacterium]